MATARDGLRLGLLAAALVAPGCEGGGAARPDVVLISIDTCRADHVGAYGSAEAATPHADALAAEGVLFERAYTTNPITLPAHASLLTGLLPPSHGVRDNNDYRLPEERETLAERLAARGYATAAFVGAFVLDARFGLAQGFATYDDEVAQDAELAGAAYAERRAEDVSARAVRWLAERGGEPVFLFLHYYDPHAVYAPPEAWRAGGDGPDAYAAEIAYTDHCIGTVLAALERAGRYDGALIVLTSDHGESLGEHGEETHSFFVYDGTLRVPLIVKPPGGTAPVRRAEPVSLVDVVPTVLSVLDLPAPRGLAGRDLTPWSAPAAPDGERALYAESLTPTKFGCAPLHAAIAGDWKYVRTARPELYELASDPGELHDRAALEPERARELDARLDALLAAARPGAGAATSLDRESRARLGALGYAADLAVDESRAAEASARDPKDFVELYEQSLDMGALVVAGHLREARELGLAILRADAGFADVYYQLGYVSIGLGRLDEAVAYLREYLARQDGALAPNASNAYNGLGYALVRLGHPDEGRAHYRRAIELDPTHVGAHANLGRALVAAGRARDALAPLRRAVELDPRSAPEPHGDLARALAALGELPAARDALEAALASWPDSAELRTDLARVELALGLDERAERGLRAVLEATPQHAAARLELAWLLATAPRAERRRPAEALELAREAALHELEPSPRTLEVLAAAHAAAGELPRAVELAERAVAGLEAGSDARAEAARGRLALYRDGRPFRRAAPKTPR